MTLAEVGFWLCIACVMYAYVFYPVFIGLFAQFRSRQVSATGHFEDYVSIVLPAYNEASAIGRRLDDLTNLFLARGRKGEIIVVSDGSTDDTVLVAKRYEKKGVRVLQLPVRAGKAEAISVGCAVAVGCVIVFADARQRWASDALENLLKNFTDPEVGGVSGHLVLETESGVVAGVGLYWRYEKWLRRAESRIHSTVGVTGAISAVRRELFRPIPKGAILDDVYWPLQVVMQGFRVVHEERAVAFDKLPEKIHHELRRKVRTLSGNFQLLTRLPAALLPWRNPIWIEFLSHKLMRLLVPWALLTMLTVSAMSAKPLYRIAFILQVAFYSLGVIGILLHTRSQPRLISTVGSFLVLNTAAWLAFWVWIIGQSESSWKKIPYHHAGDT